MNNHRNDISSRGAAMSIALLLVHPYSRLWILACKDGLRRTKSTRGRRTALQAAYCGCKRYQMASQRLGMSFRIMQTAQQSFAKEPLVCVDRRSSPLSLAKTSPFRDGAATINPLPAKDRHIGGFRWGWKHLRRSDCWAMIPYTTDSCCESQSILISTIQIVRLWW